MKTKILCPKHCVGNVFDFLMQKEMTFEFINRVDCVFIVPHIPPNAMRTILGMGEISNLVLNSLEFSETQ